MEDIEDVEWLLKEWNSLAWKLHMILGEHENAVTPEEREACQNKIVLAFREATEVITRLAEIYDPAYDDKIGRLLHYFKNLSRSRTTVNTLLNTPRSKPVEFVTEASSF